jgi:hypothetical protein
MTITYPTWTPEVNTAVIDAIEKRFSKLDIWRGKSHSLLGMNIELGDGYFDINTSDYVREFIVAFGEDVNLKVSTPATKNLCTINTRSSKLNKEQHEFFHSVASKLLWVAKRGRPDINPAVSFLCSHVKSPTRKDWMKLKRVL